MTKRITVKQLTLLSIFTALIIIQTYTPMLGYIKFLAVDFTIIHITVIIGAILLNNLLLSTILGGIWGITSMIYAYQSAGILNPLFYNPLISVVPRLIVGFVAFLVFKTLSKKGNLIVAATTSAILSTLTNTILVLGGFYLFGSAFISTTMGYSSSEQVFIFVLSLITSNTLLEIIAAAVVVPAIIKPLQRFIK